MAYEPIPLSMLPGLVATPTKESKSASWRDGNLVRWVDSKLTPVGGWERIGYSITFASTCRAIHRWTTNSGISMVAYLCEGHVYVDKGDGVLTNVTPSGGITRPNSSIVQGGYGDYTYSYDAYGTPRPDKEDTNVRITYGYYLDNWGEDLLIMTGADGRLLRWKPSDAPGTRASAVPNAPLGNRGFVVATQRHVVLFGAAGVMNQYSWCDQEDIEDWNYADVNSKAGFNTVQPASPIIACARSGNDIVFFTESGNAYYLEYQGMPYIFGGDKFASGVTPISPLSIIDTQEGCVWVSESGVWLYQSRQAVSIKSDIWQWIDSTMNKTYTRYMGAMMLNSSKSEVWWMFSSGAEGNKCDKIAIFNYVDKWWSKAALTRGAGVNGTYTGNPIMSDGVYAYKHESGDYYDGAEELPWITSFNVSMDSGASLSTLLKVMPDIDGLGTGIAYVLNYGLDRHTGTELTTDDKRVLSDGCAYFGVTGIDMRLTIKQTINGIPAWTLGDINVYITWRGQQ